jgi:hypothetical protein
VPEIASAPIELRLVKKGDGTADCYEARNIEAVIAPAIYWDINDGEDKSGSMTDRMKTQKMTVHIERGWLCAASSPDSESGSSGGFCGGLGSGPGSWGCGADSGL